MNSQSGWRIFLAFVLLCVVNSPATEAQLFDTRMDYPTGVRPEAVVVGDLDGDGILDLATANYWSQDVSVFLGQGDGIFPSCVNYPVSAYPKWVTTVDLDGDDSMDLAVVSAAGHTAQEDGIVSILMGNGDGTFQAAVDYESGRIWYSSHIEADDLNGDGNPDLIVANNTTDEGSISVYLGNGDGSLQHYVSYPTEEGCWDFAVGDLDNDGDPDLVSTNKEDGSISVLMGNGDGTFGATTNIAIGYRPSSVAISDLDGDGLQDLAVAMPEDEPDVVIGLGNGDGTFQFLAGVDLPQDASGNRLAAGDLNGDMIPDLVVTRFKATVLLGVGDGSFNEAVSYDAAYSFSVAISDLTDDGIPDVVTANGYADTVSIFRGKGDGSFPAAPRYGLGGRASSIAVVDLNKDGFLDLASAISRYSSSGVDGASVLLGNGDGTFLPEMRYLTGETPLSIAAGDFDGDGNPDLAVANHDSFDVSILLGNGDGTMQPAIRLYCGGRPNSVAVGDLDGDGNLDLVTAADGNDSVLVGLGRGNGTFRSGGLYTVGESPESIIIGDLDRDGNLDLVTANDESDDISVLMGNGDGTFLPSVEHGVDTSPVSIVLRDLDGDEVLDLVTGYDGTICSVMLGNGDGTFGTAVNYDVGEYTTSVSIHDLDGDGVSDLVACCNYGSNICVLPGNGDGTFRNGLRYGTQFPFSVAIGDLDGDGDLDLAPASYNSSGWYFSVAILLNNNTGTVTANLTCVPGYGTLPISSLFQATMANNHQGQTRRFQYTIDVTLAGGQFYSNWRRGWQNIQAGETYTKQWTQTIPDLPSVEGPNSFQMTVADVTPPPYNLPPYPPAGDTDTGSCTITGVAP